MMESESDDDEMTFEQIEEPPSASDSDTEPDLRKEFYRSLKRKQFDSAIKTIVKMRDDRKLMRKSIYQFVRLLGPYLQNLKPEREITDGWLAGETGDFSQAVENSIAQLGNDFFAILTEGCLRPVYGTPDAVSPDGPNRYLVNLFLELTQDGFLWSDIVRFCLKLVMADRKKFLSIALWGEIAEKLSNVRQFIAESPGGVMPNPLAPTKKSARKRARRPDTLISTTADSIFEGKARITLDDIEKEIAIARACSSLLKAADVLEFRKLTDGKVNVVSLAKHLSTNKLFFDAVLLAKCMKTDSSIVFADFAGWVIQISLLAGDHWDEFAKETEPFVGRLDLLDEERIFRRDREAPEIFIERILSIIQTNLADLFVELGDLSDLRAIMVAFVEKGFQIFGTLQEILSSPRFFKEVLWILMSLENSHDYLRLFLLNWLNQFESGKLLGSTAPLSMHGAVTVDIPNLSPQLIDALRQYFVSEDSQIQSNWTDIESRLNFLEEKNSFIQTKRAVALPFQKLVSQNPLPNS